MEEEKQDHQEAKSAGSEAQSGSESDTQAIIQGMTGVVTAALGVGAALAKATAEATARGRQVPAPPQGSFNPMNVMVHYSLAAMVNVMGVVAEGIGEVRQATTRASARPAGQPPAGNQASAPEATGAAPQEPNLPTVHCGSTLRIPLSVENPGQEPMAEMRFTCLAVSGGEVSVGELLEAKDFRFEPEILSVAPRDFEKLTVYVDVPETAAPGLYEAKIGPSPGNFEIILRLEVIPAAGA